MRQYLTAVALCLGLAACEASDRGLAGVNKPDTGIGFGASGAPVASISMTPGSGTLTIGDTLRLVVTPHDAQGLTLLGRTITYTSSNNTIASVSGSGLVTARLAGDVTITATSENRSAIAQFSVHAP
jgi:uncharacterized protein YjdB